MPKHNKQIKSDNPLRGLRLIKGVMCTSMIRILTIGIFLVSFSVQAQDYAWFEGNWVSDAEATIAINPEYRNSNEESLAALRSILGNIRWVIERNILTFIDPLVTPMATSITPFSIISIDTLSFDIVFEGSLPKANSNKPFDYESIDNSQIQGLIVQYIITILKTEAGFCMVPNPNFIIKADGSRVMLQTECFRPYDTQQTNQGDAASGALY